MTYGRARWIIWIAAVLFLIVGLLYAPAVVRLYWSAHSANPVRRGVARAVELGCFECHADRGSSGIPDPGLEDQEVPAWSGMVWMMYVDDEEEIREFILDGVSRKRAASPSARAEREAAAIRMPAYRDVLRGGDLDDLTAAFLVLSGMSRPPRRTPEARGFDLAREWRCFSCHGAGGSGGLANPGSFAGFIPGWYGADFDDLVRDRGEFDAWIREGAIPRLTSGRIAPYFARRQRVQMPAYRDLTEQDLDALWAYASWLEE